MIYRAICINPNGHINLQKYEEYYVYDKGGQNYYVSRFPSADKSYFGCYGKEMFSIIEETQKKVVEKTISRAELEEQQMSLF